MLRLTFGLWPRRRSAAKRCDAGRRSPRAHGCASLLVRATRYASFSTTRGQHGTHTDRVSLAQCILVDPAVLHDDEQVFLRILDQLDVGDWITVDEQQVGERAFLDDAELAWIRVSFPRQRQQLGVRSCSHRQSFGGGVPLNQLGQQRPVTPGELGREQYVGAPRRLDLVLLRQPVSRVSAREHLHRLFPLERTGRKHVGQLVRERLHAQPDALLGDQFRGRFIHQVAVFDAFHAGGDRAPDGLVRVRMHRDIGAPVPGGFNRGAQLGLGEGRCVERAVRRRHPPAGRQLDLRSALHQLLAHANADLIRTVRDHGGAKQFAARQRSAERARHFERLAKVAVTAGDGDDGTGRVDARPGDDALVDGTLEPERRPAHVANGGEPAHQCVRRLGACDQIEVSDVPHQQRCGRRPHHHRVPVVVDQAGHQRAPAAVDHRGIARHRNVTADLRDLVADDKDGRARG